MGTCRIVPYRIEYRDQSGLHTCGWNERKAGPPYFGHGRPTNAKAEDWRRQMNESLGLGGSNEHVSRAAGYILHVSHVRVYRQSTGELVASATMPSFEVV